MKASTFKDMVGHGTLLCSTGNALGFLGKPVRSVMTILLQKGIPLHGMCFTV